MNFAILVIFLTRISIRARNIWLSSRVLEELNLTPCYNVYSRQDGIINFFFFFSIWIMMVTLREWDRGCFYFFCYFRPEIFTRHCGGRNRKLLLAGRHAISIAFQRGTTQGTILSLLLLRASFYMYCAVVRTVEVMHKIRCTYAGIDLMLPAQSGAN